MQKINFHKLLMPSVLDGSKTMTRRVVPQKAQDEYKNACAICRGCGGQIPDPTKFFLDFARYKVGEVVAIAQSYNDIYEELKRTHGSSSIITREFFHKYIQGGRMPVSNKMFVKAGIMPHQIRITGIKVERLKDISDEDCIKEGVYTQDIWSDIDYCFGNICFENAQEAFRYILSKCCKPKTLWEDNPWVFAYSFELVK